MNNRPMKRIARNVISACMIAITGGTAMLAVAPSAVAATTAATTTATSVTWSRQQLDSVTAPIALYPDALLSQVLMASTYPTEVVQAAHWLNAHPTKGGDDAVKAVASQPWDPSVQSLMAVPSVLAMMGGKPDWVHQLGSAFLADPNGVMDSVQRLRASARAAGHLSTTTQQTVVVQQTGATETIVIKPTNPQVVYVPTYDPTVVYGVWAYPAMPPVYLPPPPGYAFASGLAAGIGFGIGIAVTDALWGSCDWNNHNVSINVNRYNHINVNHKITGRGSTTWRHDSIRSAGIDRGGWSRGLAHPGVGVGPVEPARRTGFAPNDTARARAQQVLGARTGEPVSGTAMQRVQGMRDTRSVAQRGAEPGLASPAAERGELARAGGRATSVAAEHPALERGAALHGRFERGAFQGLAANGRFTRG